MYSSVEIIPNLRAQALFLTPEGGNLFRETGELTPIPVTDKISVMPWGADNQMPYNILDRIEQDETISTCQTFNAEICYGAGLQYDTAQAPQPEADTVRYFLEHNDLQRVWYGQALDLKFWGFSVVVLYLNKQGNRIVSLQRKEAINCRFSVANRQGRISHIVYADWRRYDFQREHELIPLLAQSDPLADLQYRISHNTRDRKFAVLCRIPTADSIYYPIPYYGSLFRSRWYDIKQLIATAKYAKLRNSAPLKYQIEISQRYWENLFAAEGITELKKKQERVKQEKENIVNFLTGAENAGKALFSTFYISPNGEEQHEVQIKKIDEGKEGGDWESDIQEAINIICFTMGVHSNLVGSVPGKAQTNNSGSDKRELYTIAQARQRPYHELMFRPHRLLCTYNGWHNVQIRCPFLMLTTLDQHTDAQLAEA